MGDTFTVLHTAAFVAVSQASQAAVFGRRVGESRCARSSGGWAFSIDRGDGRSSTQPRDDGACHGELSFIIGGTWRIATIAHRFKRYIDLAECGLSHGGILPPVGEEHKRDAFVAERQRPFERHAFTGPFLQSLVIGNDSLFKLRRPALACSESVKRIAKIVLDHGPIEWHALAGPFLQSLIIGSDSLFNIRRPALACSENVKRSAKIVLDHGPIERHALAGPFLQSLVIGSDSLFNIRRPALACSENVKRRALACSESVKRIAQIVLGHGPVERHALAGPFLQ